MLSGLGERPSIELYRDVRRHRRPARAAQRRTTVARALVGDYIKSLDMAGCSLTLLARTTGCCAWDAPVSTAGSAGGA